MDKSKVTAAKPDVAGAAYWGPTSATLPTTTSATLTGFTGLGYVSEDGMSNERALDREPVKAWGGDTVMVIHKGLDDKFKFVLIEGMNLEVLKIAHGSGNATESSGTITVISKNEGDEAHAFVFDMILRGGAKKRIVVPSAFVLEVAEVKYTDTDVIGYEITLQCSADSDGGYHYEYITPASSSSSSSSSTT